MILKKKREARQSKAVLTDKGYVSEERELCVKILKL